jgi:hypothetical protein
MDDILVTLRALLELGAPAIYLVMLFTLWREYRRLNDLLIEILRERRSSRRTPSDNGAHSESA